ncbi:MAG TPA: hypothetical protein VIM53_00730 [Candidatus Saccharimonadales bacterium]
MELYPRDQNQERVEMVPFELKVSSLALPFAVGAVRHVYLRCVRSGNRLFHQGRQIADHGVPNFDFAARKVASVANAPVLGRLGLG